MKLSKKILRAINEGVINALSFDDEDFDAEDMQLLKVSGHEVLKDNTKTKICAQLIIKDLYVDACLYAQLNPNVSDKERINHSKKAFKKIYDLYKTHGAKLIIENDEMLRRVINWVAYDLVNMNSVNKNSKKQKRIDLNWIDTSNVTNMAELFYHLPASQLTDIDISDWDTHNVTNMFAMFKSSNVKYLDLSNWDVSNVEIFDEIFKFVKADIDLSNWNVNDGASVDGALAYSALLDNEYVWPLFWRYKWGHDKYKWKGKTFLEFLNIIK